MVELLDEPKGHRETLTADMEKDAIPTPDAFVSLLSKQTKDYWSKDPEKKARSRDLSLRTLHRVAVDGDVHDFIIDVVTRCSLHHRPCVRLPRFTYQNLFHDANVARGNRLSCSERHRERVVDLCCGAGRLGVHPTAVAGLLKHFHVKVISFDSNSSYASVPACTLAAPLSSTASSSASSSHSPSSSLAASFRTVFADEIVQVGRGLAPATSP